MKKLIISLSLFLSLNSYAKDCKTVSEQEVKVLKEDVNTPVPKKLEGSVIIVRSKDGSESIMSIDDYKVVPRKQQFKVSKTRVIEKMMCEDKNALILGAKKDYTGLDTEISKDGKSASIIENKSTVLDLSYMRRKVLGDVGVGAGVDTNGTVKGMVGIDF